MKRADVFAASVAMALLAGCATMGQPKPDARAEFRSADGVDHGEARLFQQSAGVLIRASIKNLADGEHGFHIHAVGKCESPFESAGPHYNPTMRKHGRLNPDGAHSGDLPNLSSDNHTAHLETLVRGLKLESLFDADSSALIVHEKKDDYKTDPSGNSGPRVLCAVIRRPVVTP